MHVYTPLSIHYILIHPSIYTCFNILLHISICSYFSPFAPLHTLIAAKIVLTGGEAKTLPTTAHDNIPSPTNPACNGSWPIHSYVKKINV